MNSNDPGLQDSAIPLLTEVLDNHAATTPAAPRTAASAPSGLRPAAPLPQTPLPQTPLPHTPAPNTLATNALASNAPAPDTPAFHAAAPNPPTQPAQPPVQAVATPVARPVLPAHERVASDDEAGIPVLTVPLKVAAPPAPAITPAPATPAPAKAAPINPATRPPADVAESGIDAMAARLTPEEIEQMQHKLTERILRQLQGRIDFVLEQRVRDSLADVLQLAMGGLTNDIKRGLQHTLEEVVGRAVAQEIARLQSGKK